MAVEDIKDVVYHGKANQLHDEVLFIGFTTTQKVQKLLNDGDVKPRKLNQFYQAIRQFYEVATSDVFAKLPLYDKVLLHAQFVDLFSEERRGFDDVKFFMDKYPGQLSLSASHTERLQEKIVEYQMLRKADIPERIWEDARVKPTEKDEDGVEDEETAFFFRMHVIWGHLGSVKLTDGSLKFGRLAKVTKTVLILPNSNAGDERVFSVIRENKTDFRASLQVDDTLASLMTIKLASSLKFEPPLEVLAIAKTATHEYNMLHKK